MNAIRKETAVNLIITVTLHHHLLSLNKKLRAAAPNQALFTRKTLTLLSSAASQVKSSPVLFTSLFRSKSRQEMTSELCSHQTQQRLLLARCEIN